MRFHHLIDRTIVVEEPFFHSPSVCPLLVLHQQVATGVEDLRSDARR